MIPFDIPPLSAVDALDTEPQHLSTTPVQIWRFHDEYVLGTRLEVVVNAKSAVLANEAARAARFEIDRLERVFNHRHSDSEISALNRMRRASVSPELFAVVQTSELWRLVTRGAFDARIGELLQLWRNEAEPDRASVEHICRALRNSSVGLNAAKRTVELPAATRMSFDAVAKGYIVDAALTAARRAVPALEGIAVSIGGDLRCWGVGAGDRGWQVGIADLRPVWDAPLADAVILRNQAIATSGIGPRDRVGNGVRSSTLSPFTGRPVRGVLGASVVASHAVDADAIATACMVLTPDESLAIVDQLEGVTARITDSQGNVHTSAGWPLMQLAAATPEEHIEQRSKKQLPASARWPTDWVLSIDYTAPPRQPKRESDFRSPYMAMWITDARNKPVRTVLMVGRESDWQRDNFVWWGTNRARAPRLVEMRSLPTSISGHYPVHWAGVDDDWNPVPIGSYTLHLETSQERGKHYYRSIPLELGRDEMRTELPKLEGSGGIVIYYGHPNEHYRQR